MYVYIYLYIQYILHCAFCTDARDKQTRSDTETRSAKKKFFIYFFFFPPPKRRSYGAIARARSRVSRNSAQPFVESHTTFPPIHPSTNGTSEISFYFPTYSNPRVKSASRRPTAHVYLRLSAPQNFKLEIFRSTFFSLSLSAIRYLLGRLEPIANADLSVSRPFSMRVSLDSEKNSSRSNCLDTPSSDEFNVFCV